MEREGIKNIINNKQINLIMKKNYLLIAVLIVLFSCLNGVAQTSYDKFQAFKESILNDKSKYKGEGCGKTMEEAGNMALQTLAGNIFTYVISETGQVIENKEQNGSASTTTQTVSKLKVCSPGVFENVQTRSARDKNGMYIVLKYVDTLEVYEQDRQRIADIKAWMEAAINCEKDGDVAGALKHAYWAQAMLNCLQSNPMSIYDDKGMPIVTQIPGFIQNILTNIKAKVESQTPYDPLAYMVKFTYKGNIVSNMRFEYYNGGDEGNWPIETIDNGTGTIHLIDNYPTNTIRLKWIYRNDDMNGVSMKDVLDCSVVEYENMAKIDFPEHVKNPENAEKNKNLEIKTEVSKKQNLSVPLSTAKQYSEIIGEVCRKITSCKAVSKSSKASHYAEIKHHFTESGFDEFMKLIGYGKKITVLSNNLDLSYTNLNGYTYCRSVRMNFSFSYKRTFTESVVFQFDETGKISGLSFALGERAVATHFDGVGGKGNEADDNILRNLLENYRTAYALEDTSYINSIFSPDALIITGKKLKTYTGNDVRKLTKDKYEFQQMTVKEYKKRLDRIFKANEFINIQFSDYVVRKVPNDYSRNIYAIQVKQDYFSSIYGDTGYLFLYVDITNPNAPVIHIRAWQDKIDPDWGYLNENHVL